VGVYGDRVFPWLLDHTESREMSELRRVALRDVGGEILEIGVGTGANIPFYPAVVGRLTAVEPSDAMRRRAVRRADARGLALDWHRGSGERLPLEDARFDSVVLVDVLCSVDDEDTVLAEAYRVLRPGGRLHFLEHGLSDDDRVSKWQRRLNGVNTVTACGCRLTREPEKRIRASRFVVDELVQTTPLTGTGVLFPHIRGIASRAAH
jgi:ubiquinone/menaquinone biosynthesis C-methylase UbiE